MEGTIGEIRIFGGNFAPASWNYCNGVLLSIAEYTALYSIIGTTYGGDGQQTFALPDFRGRIPVGTGQGGSLPSYTLGQTGGQENVTMTPQTMPMHTHPTAISYRIPASKLAGNSSNPIGTVFASLANAYTNDPGDSYLASFPANIALNVTGNGIPFNVMQPYLALNYIICLEGIFPSRN